MAEKQEVKRIVLSGRVDSTNATETEKNIIAQLADVSPDTPVEIDMTDLQYISSAGLRVLLRVKKTNPELSLTGVNSEVYEILDMTGFTEMMTVRKAYRVVSIEGCEEIGRGAN
ncbi:MAG: STAS domain-containing protein, partial [Lachnospiraceae bacterium]|nr:STAS domain-containing protein [Lachnospiraceae bacterium]